MLMNLLLLLGAYLLGSVSSAVVVGRLMGHGDPREVGSGNPGATNVLRQFGKLPAALTLCGDVLKGYLPLLAGDALHVGVPWLAAIGLTAFLGHLFPVFFGFRGGKGVATFIGVLFGYGWPLGVCFLVIWLLMALATRYSSLSALTAAALAPVITFQFTRSVPYLLGVGVMVVLIFWRHRSNIRKLLSGEEHKIGHRG